MSNAKFLIPKQNQQLPDRYLMKIIFLDGSNIALEIASHTIIDNVFRKEVIRDDKTSKTKVVNIWAGVASVPVLECVTKDDKWYMFPLGNIKSVEFDQNFSKMVALKEEEATKKK